MKNFSLSAKERIKKRKDFEILYSTGKTIYSSSKIIKAIFKFDKIDDEAGVKVAVVVGKKQGNAVWRNRVKRLIRESYRTNKKILFQNCLDEQLALKIIFAAHYLNERKNKKLELKEIMPDVIEIMSTIRNLL